VSSSNAFKWLLATVLLISFAWKIAIPSEKDSDDGLVAFLKRNHFAVAVTTSDVQTIQAQSDSCRLRVVKLESDGSNRDLVRQLASGKDRSFVVFRGRVYDQQPTLLTRISYIWFERLRELGLVKHLEPVIAVIADPSCHAEGLPWNELNETS
jgi:hypothetical protein